ncbi:helix-turn-helix transcriptional regulator [Microbispora sp. NBC_01389]|uniref:helix-turn-helix transcriptional regulator n=1 Tax=Microbispora sp. NBC_01389 TaxID=2903584 RepID=UPI00324DCC6F
MTRKEATFAAEDDRLWSVEDVAGFLGVPVATVYAWRHRRVGPKGRRIGRHLRYLPEDVRAWVREQT